MPLIGMTYEGSLEAVRLLARLLGRDLDEASIEDLFLSSPSYPSLLSISDGLRTIGIEHEAVEVAWEDLDALDLPCLVRLHDGSLLVLTEITPTTVTAAQSARQRELVPRAELLSRWTGTALLPTAVRVSRYRPPGYGASVPPRLVASAAVGVLAAAAAITWRGTPRALELGVMGALGASGLLLSVLLAAEELGYRTPATRLCSATRRSSCQSVLLSPAARLGPICMTDLGLGVFAGVLLMVIAAPAVPGGTAALVAALRGLGLTALPYTIFSLAYQAFRLRIWCPLCVLVQLVLWAIAGLAWHAPWPSPRIATPAWGLLALAVLPGFAWLAVKPAIQRGRAFVLTRRALERTARDPVIVRALLASAPPASLEPVPLEIAVGASRPIHTVTAYLNPTCAHCRVRQRELVQILEHAGAHVRVILRIVGPTWADPAALALVATIAQELAAGQHERAFELMDQWARGRTRLALLQRPEALTGAARQRYTDHRAAMQRRLPVAEIPALFVDGCPWPAELSICGVSHLAREASAGSMAEVHG